MMRHAYLEDGRDNHRYEQRSTTVARRRIEA